MRNFVILLVSGLVLGLVLIGGAYVIFPTRVPEQPAIVVPVNSEVEHLAETVVQQAASYRATVTALEQETEDVSQTLEAQVDTLSRQVQAAEQELARLKSQEEELLAQLEQLQAERAAKLQGYQQSLEQTKADHLAKQADLQAQLNRLQAELEAINARLAE